MIPDFVGEVCRSMSTDGDVARVTVKRPITVAERVEGRAALIAAGWLGAETSLFIECATGEPAHQAEAMAK